MAWSIEVPQLLKIPPVYDDQLLASQSMATGYALLADFKAETDLPTMVHPLTVKESFVQELSLQAATEPPPEV